LIREKAQGALPSRLSRRKNGTTWFQLAKMRLTNLINTAPGESKLSPALGLCHQPRGEHLL